MALANIIDSKKFGMEELLHPTENNGMIITYSHGDTLNSLTKLEQLRILWVTPALSRLSKRDPALYNTATRDTGERFSRVATVAPLGSLLIWEWNQYTMYILTNCALVMVQVMW